MHLDPAEILPAVLAAMEEDVGTGDATTLATVPPHIQVRAYVRAREPLVLAGIQFAEAAFRATEPGLTIRHLSRDGDLVATHASILEINGPARAILTAERVALNFLQRLSGIATIAAKYVEAVRGTGAIILDTRKTTPGWRRFEKYAVKQGGANNHRVGLYDMILIKDNHLVALRNEIPNPIHAAVQRARAAYPNLRVEVEADTLEQVQQAVDARADIVLLDNMTLDQLRAAVAICDTKTQTEASGGVNLDTVRAIAETGVNYISVGAITHSSRAVDIALDFNPTSPP
jgi:nicotinate-nucleotide pyrophosphorylase (carboxylating)